MKKTKFTILALSCLISVWLFNSAHAFEVVTREMIEKEVVTTTDLIRTADNFIVLFDTSSSTNQMVPGGNISKIQAAKDLLKKRNAWLPDLGYKAGLYIYTAHETLTGTFKEIYGMQPYNADRFGEAIDQLPEKGQGGTTLNAGLSPLRKTIAGLSGKTAIIMFTDGKTTRIRRTKQSLQIAQEIAKDHDICFYLISSATEEANKELLKTVANVNACSRVIPLTAFLENPHYLSGALFTVKTDSYERLIPFTQVVGVVADDMLFDFDNAAIRSEYHQKLDMLGNYLQENPDTHVVARGYADSVGGEEYNLALSERRVASVKAYLMDKFSIDKNRIVTLWFGELNPVANNATSDGRKRNRRVEIAVGGIN